MYTTFSIPRSGLDSVPTRGPTTVRKRKVEDEEDLLVEDEDDHDHDNDDNDGPEDEEDKNVAWEPSIHP
jgi:hypothetical protein